MAELFCDICGNGPVRAQILVEGAKMLACSRCMRSGKILMRLDDDDEGEPIVRSIPTTMESSEEIVEGYGKIIIAAREKLGLPIAVVAERLKEKESYLHAIEHERLAPTMEVARKLEKELGIKLVEKVAGTMSPALSKPSSKNFQPPTLGDMIDAKKKKEK
ncbi:Helix-turn-helix [Candidatus Bilamarchaeum dharawalense]|uniref:Helix-turn-helix n=1 Tax=Candidatus Bilamarchaeum dharawalense TaxID=2885759 RepID=A0A5E4LUX4_9ARCH|nr:Helix-turn-helix [Candidatus Bilamarchaeum dharawalense]